MAISNHIDNTIETIESHPLNAEYINGISWATSATANTIAARDSNGFLYCVYINTSNFPEEPAWDDSTRLYYDNGDGWLRKMTATKWAAQFNSKYALVTSVAGKTGAVTLSKSDVGLGNVDNTADANKSVNYANSAGSASSATNATNATYLGTASAGYSYSSLSTALSGKAASGHTHTLKLESSTGTSSITLSAATKYQLTAGGSTYIFTTPSDTNTWRGIQNNLTSDSTTDSLSAAQGKVLNAAIASKADSGHTHTISIASSTGTSSISLKANTNYQLTAGGQSYIFTTPTDTTYSFTNNNPTLSWGTTSSIGTVGGTTLQVTMPANPNTWRGIQNNLTSTSTTDSLSAYQGKLLNDALAGKAAASHSHVITDVTDMTTEAWVFTLEDGSTVTKTICLKG